MVAMLILANVGNALEQLWSNKLRSMLTVLGIVIAVASTITVVGVIQGFTAYVATFLQGLGTNAMWVWPERPPGEAGKRLGRIELDVRDMDAITKGCPALRRVSALIRRDNATIHYGREEVDDPARRRLGRLPRDPQLPRRDRPAVRGRSTSSGPITSASSAATS